MFVRSEFDLIKKRLAEKRRFIQVVLGPRQVGKTTLVLQVLKNLQCPTLYFSADRVLAGDAAWLSSCWTAARLEAKNHPKEDVVLAIDEVQKIENFSEIVKREWDEDTRENRSIKVLLLGSSRALMVSGLSEPLTGRFEEIRMTHWTYSEMKAAFGLTLDEFIFFGGFPGPTSFIAKEEDRWKAYVQSAIVEATVNRDIFEDNRIANAALLRRTLELGIRYSGKILSLTKLLGELQGKGNTATIASYIEKLNEAGLLAALSKFSINHARRRASIPKFQVWNNALCAAFCDQSFREIRQKPELWGHCVESAVGAYLVSQSHRSHFDVMYWREGNDEVDFVLKIKGKLIAIEVKSNGEKRSKGLAKFSEKFHPEISLIVGEGGLPLETFFLTDPLDLVS